MAKKKIKGDSYKQDPKNYNLGTEEGDELLGKSIEENGLGRSILVANDGTVIAGNKTLKKSLEQNPDLEIIEIETTGNQLVVVKRNDIEGRDDMAFKKLALADNKTGQVNLNWDVAAMVDDLELDELKDWGFTENDLFTGNNVDNTKNVVAEPSLAEELQKKWKTELGQIWQIGEHRIICGDSTDPETYKKLMGEDQAECMWTDPPYGVSYVGKTKDSLEIDNDGAEGLPELLKGFFGSVVPFLKPNARAYVASPSGRQGTDFRIAIRESDLILDQGLAWVKQTMVLGRTDYHYRHEDILYCHKPGAGRGGRGKTESSMWRGDNSQTTVLEHNMPARNAEHPTMKPIELIQHCLGNSCRPGKIVLDPFNGSGSTGIAANAMGMIYRGIELDPRFIAVTLERFEKAGEQCTLLTS
jgi:site-specific DNA-methyltransferase (adenine-specific)